METKGHIINDEQFAEYQEFIKNKFNDNVSIGVARNFWDGSSRGDYNPDHFFIDSMFNINFKSITFTEDVGKLVDKVRELCKQSEDTTKILINDYKKEYNKAVDKFKREIFDLEEKRNNLLKSPTIWQFIKNRYK